MIPKNTKRGRPPQDTETRLLSHVKKDVRTGCWVWTGGKYPAGYGKTYDGYTKEGKINITYAHRVMWKCVNGDPGVYHVLHTCDNPSCVNPDHLFLGNHADNMRDMALKGRSPYGKLHPRGSSKLTKKDVMNIRKSKLPYRTLSYRYGVSETQISRIRCMRSWEHI